METRKMNRLRMVFAIVVAMFVTMSLSAQNLLNNGDFDSSTGGWNNWAERFDWVSDDGVAPSGNGCAEQGDSMLNGGVATTEQIVPITPDASYNFSAHVKLPIGSLATSAWMMVQYLDGSGSYLGEQITVNFPGSLADGEWHDFASSVVAPNYAQSVNFVLGVGTPASGTGEAVLRWDNVVFGPAGPAASLFADGFESGDTSSWSSATP